MSAQALDDSETRLGGPLHQRPDLAGDGRLVRPVRVELADGFLVGELSDAPGDPFEATSDRLLLAESFARLDLADERAALSWFREQGVLNLVDWYSLFAEVPSEGWSTSRQGAEFADRLIDVAAEQANVRWHLDTLARLSERRESMDWDARLGQLIVVSLDGRLIVGGEAAGSELHNRTILDALAVRDELPPALRAAARADIRVAESVAEWPTVTVAPPAWLASWRPQDLDPSVRMPEQAKAMARVLGTSWDQTVELERILMAPYVERATERRFATWRGPSELTGQKRNVVMAGEIRLWRSILAPIYLQLFEALRNISYGTAGAALCRECGQPFLVLDARRHYFCNARERYRFTKRQQRRIKRSGVEQQPDDEPDAVDPLSGADG